MKNKLLDNINYPSDLRKLSKNQLDQVSKELRSELINVVSETGGHLGAGLGAVELTVALHYVFDYIVWHPPFISQCASTIYRFCFKISRH